MAQINDISDLFSATGTAFILRSRLRELVWKILQKVKLPYEILNKTLDLGWRKIWYEPINVTRSLKKKVFWSQEDAAYIEHHLAKGIDHYRSVIAYLSDTTNRKDGSNFENWKNEAFLRCFTSLGDLSRYRMEFEDLNDKQRSNKHARFYYNKALLIDPKNRMLFNKLAALDTYDTIITSVLTRANKGNNSTKYE